ncbi:MAG TPA: hypothetical protein VEB40_15840 [Flavipsychrobacter sp.]|nr:hypothetical protein [Flavipsychrobacter sp.]
MKDQILSNFNNPVQLEKLYRADRSAFKKAFNSLYPQLEDNPVTGYWDARLNFAKEDFSLGTNKGILFVIIASVIAGIIAKLPDLLIINEEFFYSRNIGFIVFPMLAAYFAWKNKLPIGKIAIMTITGIAALIFINVLPDSDTSDTLVLSCIHLILFLWSILGFAFVGGVGNDGERRLGFLKYNGDLVVMTTLIVIAGAILTGVTIGLFSLIGYHIEVFYFDNIVVFALPAAPILGTYLTQTNPNLVGKVSPVIAKIFSPLVLVMLVIYLIAITYSGKDPYNDREFLMIFNALLVGVMAIVFFSIAETSKGSNSNSEKWILFLLCLVTIIVNGIALSAILFRIFEWGITPNRAAVLGGNVLILVNLVLVTLQLYKVVSRKADISGVGKVIASYLPVYCIWTTIVTFVFPLIFGFR